MISQTLVLGMHMLLPLQPTQAPVDPKYTY